ncbi:GNAT family N-acetyltransferase [Streptomyces roseoverticillatus]|nr:GNAT family N-acetyltransferase [Streptomyces roseoverticillatus]
MPGRRTRRPGGWPRRTGTWVGPAEYHAPPARPPGSGPVSAEVALPVADEWHHRGVGTLLLEHLVACARADGLRELTAETLSENLRSSGSSRTPASRCTGGSRARRPTYGWS